MITLRSGVLGAIIVELTQCYGDGGAAANCEAQPRVHHEAILQDDRYYLLLSVKAAVEARIADLRTVGADNDIRRFRTAFLASLNKLRLAGSRTALVHLHLYNLC